MQRRRLGQHFLKSDRIAKAIISEAAISSEDVVYEIGTGLGILTEGLCRSAKRVISVESDRNLFEAAGARLSHIENLTLRLGNGFGSVEEFTVFVSNLPYSQSRPAMEWLASTSFSHGVIMVQKEFAQKLLSRSASGRRAVRVVANHTLEIARISNVGRRNFDPPPAVDSVLLRIRKKRTVKRPLIHAINGIFSYRRKTVQNILKQFGEETDMDSRLEDLSDEELAGIAERIAKA